MNLVLQVIKSHSLVVFKNIYLFHSFHHTQLDQLASKQQASLEKAGVPGFRVLIYIIHIVHHHHNTYKYILQVTSDPQEVRVQMYLLEFILKLSKEQGNLNS